MNNKKSILAGLIGLALLAGCSQAPDTADKHSGLALANMDTRVKPGDDFFRYVNGHWLATAKIPDDRPADGAFYMLRDKSLADVRVLVEGLDAKASADTQARQIRDLYTSYLDQAGRDAKGTTPLLPLLGEIDQIRDQNGLARAFARSGQLGAAPRSASGLVPMPRHRTAMPSISISPGSACQTGIITSKPTPTARPCARNTSSTSPVC